MCSAYESAQELIIPAGRLLIHRCQLAEQRQLTRAGRHPTKNSEEAQNSTLKAEVVTCTAQAKSACMGGDYRGSDPTRTRH